MRGCWAFSWTSDIAGIATLWESWAQGTGGFQQDSFGRGGRGRGGRGRGGRGRGGRGRGRGGGRGGRTPKEEDPDWITNFDELQRFADVIGTPCPERDERLVGDDYIRMGDTDRMVWKLEQEERDLPNAKASSREEEQDIEACTIVVRGAKSALSVQKGLKQFAQMRAVNAVSGSDEIQAIFKTKKELNTTYDWYENPNEATVGEDAKVELIVNMDSSL